MKKVLKLSSLLAAVLLLAALAGVQLLSAQVATTVTVDNTHVGNSSVTDSTPSTPIDNVVRVTVVYAPTGAWVPFASTTVTVKNNTTSETTKSYTLQANASTTPNIWLLDLMVVATTTGLASDQTTSVISALADGQASGTVYGVDGDELVISLGPPVVFAPSVIVTVDTKGPAITDIAPVHDLRTKGGTLIFKATLTDAGVGLGSEAADVVAATSLLIEEVRVSVTATKPADKKSTVSAILAVPTSRVTWSIKARDALGNETLSDSIPDDNDATTAGDEGITDHSLVVDIVGPEIDSATTGVVIDTTGDDPMSDPTGSRTAVAVTFLDGGGQEAGGGLNGSTVEDSDFRVDVDGQAQAITSVVWNEGLPLMVFITLENELAGDDTPTVRLVGPVDDIAGNSTGTGQKVATDGISPKLTVSVHGSSGNATNGTLTVLVSSDEKSRNPSRNSGITVTKVVEAADGEENEGEQIIGTTIVNAASFRTVTSGEQWQWTFNFKEGAKDGKYNVCVEVKDISGDTGNAGMGGTCAAAALIDDDEDGESVVFEVDTGIGAPIVTPETTDNTNGFIEVDMAGESDEYVGDSHSKIAVLTVSLDGESVDVNTFDDKKFTIAPPADGYTVGAHEFVVTATDEVGNTKTFSKVTVTITERAAFTINLRPGYNLISLPGTPESTDINDVIGADHAINQVLTYSPFIEGGWLSAERGDDGAFEGTLTTIDGTTAYIVRTSSFKPLEVAIPRTTLGNVLPPQTNLGVGWNLVPVIDLSSDSDSGDKIADYFEGVGEAILYIDDSGRLTALEDDDATVGKGYWIYASRPAVLLPRPALD